MRNQPKYSIFKNAIYALAGMKDILSTERSFQIEAALAFVFIPILIYIDVEINTKLIMLLALFGVLIAEAINSAIERTVDLVTLDYHILAKRAKDAGSAMVFLSVVAFISIWSIVIFEKVL